MKKLSLNQQLELEKLRRTTQQMSKEQLQDGIVEAYYQLMHAQNYARELMKEKIDRAHSTRP